MTPIDGVARAMRLLRRRLGATPQSPASGRSAPDAPDAADGQAADGADRPLEGAVAARLRQLDATDPGFAEQATEVFVETVLLAEFGAQMTNDAQFRGVIRSVAREMRSQADTAAELDRLLRSLRD